MIIYRAFDRAASPVLAACFAACLAAFNPGSARAAVSVVSTVNGTPVANSASFSLGGVVVTGGNVLVAHIVKGNGTAAPLGPPGWVRQTLSTNATGNFSLSTWTRVAPASGTFA